MAYPPERRRAPRAVMVGKLFGRMETIDRQLVVRDVSLGGMSIETPVPIDLGSVLRFVLTLGDGAGVEVAGRVVRCAEVAGPEGPFFVSGVQFLDDDADASQMPDLMHRIDAPRD